MFNIRFLQFSGGVDIQEPSSWAVQPGDPVSIHFVQPGDLTKHETLRRFNKILQAKDISYLRPMKSLTGEWLIDLRELRHSFIGLQQSTYLDGRITLEPEHFVKTKYDESGEDVISEETFLKFSIYPEDVTTSSIQFVTPVSGDLQDSISRFQKDYPNNRKCAFLMMKFEDTPIHKEIIKVLKSAFKEKGIELLRADDREYSDDLLGNIKTYMHCCAFGVALFERVNSDEFNPNVSLEIGYMMAMNKPVLLLKDKTLKALHTDLVGKLYRVFDYQNVDSTLPHEVHKWLADKEL